MKRIFIESDLSSFEDFHDHNWLIATSDNLKGSPIENIFEDFYAQWYGTARAFILPWLLINGVYDSICAFVTPNKSKQELWEEYLQQTEFKCSLWKLAESTFCSLYYAYENMLVNILMKITGNRHRVTDRDFNKIMIQVYGDKIVNKVWSSNFVTVSKEIRNSIVHNGGKATQALYTMKPLPCIENGDVLISASDTRNLYNQLKPLVSEIIKESIAKLNNPR